MTDPKKDETIIELTEVVEEAPGAAAGNWMETTPPSLPPKKTGEPPKVSKKESPASPGDFKSIPESPLKKFLLAEEETSPAPSMSPREEKATGISPSEPWHPTPPPPRPATEPPRRAPEPPPRKPPEFSAPAAQPPLPDVETEMRFIREAMLAKVEKWAAQEGERILERVAREIFPKVAREMMQKEIEKLKAEAEEKE